MGKVRHEVSHYLDGHMNEMELTCVRRLKFPDKPVSQNQNQEGNTDCHGNENDNGNTSHNLDPTELEESSNFDSQESTRKKKKKKKKKKERTIEINATEDVDNSTHQNNNNNNSNNYSECPQPEIETHYHSDSESKSNHESTDKNTHHVDAEKEKDKKFKCQVCSKAYKYINQLQNHQLMHFGPRSFHCDMCPKKFYLRRILDDHDKNIHADEKNKEYICTRHGKGFGILPNYASHIKRIHQKQRDFECSYCGQNYFTKYDRDRHVFNIHLDERPFPCPYDLCGRAFKMKFNLNSHIQKTHLTEKKKQTRRRKKKQRTQRIIDSDDEEEVKERERQTRLQELEDFDFFECGTCHLIFTKEIDYRNHRLSLGHATFRPHECYICRDNFVSIKKLNQHIINHREYHYPNE